MIGKVLGDRYELIERIGGGGMALVYKAKCNLLNRYVAVKILRPEFKSDEEFIKSFRQESQSAASLSHHNIVNIYDVGKENDTDYIVMEYVENKTLKQIIKSEGPLNSNRVIKIGKQIALALEHAHGNHIIHRDIKPHNILVTSQDTAKVTDFGIARAVTSSTITNAANVIGSVHYFSPEQARGGYVSEKSDIYSLGIVLYEMATGKLPFEGEKPLSIALKHINEEVQDPRKINKNIPKALADIILKATQREQSKRYENAMELYKDLDKAQEKPMGNFVDFMDKGDSPTMVIPAIDEKQIKSKDKKSKKENNRLIIWSALLLAFISALMVTVGGLYLKDILFVKEVNVPKVVGTSEDSAKKELLKLGLKAEITNERFSNEYEKGYVIEQDPKEGIKRKEGYPVSLIVSKGKELVQTPNLINKKLENIDITLENAKLQEGKVKYKYSSMPVGIIMDQDPRGGQMVEIDSPVNLVVSQGVQTKTILMPTLTGKFLKEAKKTIEASGLVLGKVEYKESEEEKDMVIWQNLKGGTEVEENQVVNLSVSEGSPVTQPSEEDEFKMKSISFRLFYDQANNEDFRLKIVKTQNGIQNVVHDKIHNKSMSGKEKITIEGRGKASIDIYFDDVLIADKQIDFETGNIDD
ncbi:MAG: Stk1 family PASTA domain-containing Ser/Thr kinase [Anaeromicrobium sp.]|jgi:serine/threonine-protein kinase|uniref:Stk1 family PASTA domain-containing Ser/Thr kinase n=1 Tax=Anaeromicrobium sp. TaxID=1929132 RepID=UPI0025CD7646|nr:Stk1 family PASTA domain-containing Ser/Thr kinase [Anaeromicrobium sp.]MCT4594897.1 Stk1 family PASTA domain-containing Ser/Thr kinase [Anaeromicrobium sp.]